MLCACYTGESPVEVTTSNDITDCQHDDKSTTGLFCVSDVILCTFFQNLYLHAVDRAANPHDFRRSLPLLRSLRTVSVRSTAAGPHYSSPMQPPLASGAAKNHFQDCGVEMHPRHHTSISARILRAGGETSRTSSTAIGISWMCQPAKSTDVGGPAQLCLAQAHSVEQFAISTAWQQPVTEHV